VNITLIAAFISTFSLIDADIDITRRALSAGKGYEGNPISAMFTSSGEWRGLYLIAGAAHVAAFFAFGYLGWQMRYIADARYDRRSIAWILQGMYLLTVSAIELYAISTWISNEGMAVSVSWTPIFILF
jgi:hypothetical protein